MEQFIKNLARGAGAILRDGFGKKLQITAKGNFWDFATQYDYASEKFIVEKIRAKYPGHGILGEEQGPSGSKKEFWLIDPLDGTRNFSRGIPYFCVLIAYIKNNQILLGTVYDAVHNQLFFAKKHGGAYLNGKKIRVGPVDKLESTMAATAWSHSSKTLSRKIQNMMLQNEIWNNSLCTGGLTLAYVASGMLDFDLRSFGQPWDYAAGALLVQEAGGKVSDINGKPYRWDAKSVIAANPVLHKKIIEALK